MIRSQYHKIIFPFWILLNFGLTYDSEVFFLQSTFSTKVFLQMLTCKRLNTKIYVIVGLRSSSKGALETLRLKEGKERGAYISFETLIGEFKMPSCESTFKNGIYKPETHNYIISSPMDHSCERIGQIKNTCKGK